MKMEMKIEKHRVMVVSAIDDESFELEMAESLDRIASLPQGKIVNIECFSPVEMESGTQEYTAIIHYTAVK